MPEAGSGGISSGPTLTLRQILMRPDVIAFGAGALALGFVLALGMRRARRPDRDPPSAKKQSGSASAATLKIAAESIVFAVVVGAFAATTALAGPGHDHGDGGHDAAPAATGSTPRKLPDGSVFVPKPSQRLLEVRTEPANEQSASSVKQLIGTVIPDPTSFGQVQAPMDGQIEVAERGVSFVGQKVQAGEVLALLSPSIPVADLGTMQQLRAEVEGRLVVAELKLGRLKRIESVVARGQIDDTEAELAALREQKRVLVPKDIEKMALKAPVSGVISVANVRAGQVVSARDTLFEIVDPENLWVEAISGSAHDEGAVGAAEAVDSHGHSLKLSFVGRAPTLRQQSRPYLFRIEGSHPELVIGAPVQVRVSQPESVTGIIVPDAAVVRGANGLHRVWVKESPEQFRAIEVRTSAIEGGRTLILAGLTPGDRVVVNAAELINQIR